MCGIAGIFRTAGVWAPDRELVEAMNRHQADRGPDSAGVWMDDHLVLGHTRLAIMDPLNAAASQPYVTENWVISFNGEIYNFRALRETLRARHIPLETDSDTEVLAKSIELFGLDAALEKLNGMFAIAAYEKRARRLHLVRDRLGIKPLYFFYDPAEGVLVFASTPAAIARTFRKRWDLDVRGLYSFFSLGAPAGTHTLFEGITRVLPAQKLTIEPDRGLEGETYWRPRFTGSDIAEQIVSSIALQKESHVPSAVFLSGGVDSSLMASVLSDVTCFHLDSEEREYAEYVANFLGVELKVGRADAADDFQSQLRLYSRSSGEVSASSPIPSVVSGLIAQSGFKVAFSANGADELFHGYWRTPTPELRPDCIPAVFYEKYVEDAAAHHTNHIFRNPAAFKTLYSPGEDYSVQEEYGITGLDAEFPESARYRWLELMSYVAFDLNPTLDFSSMASSIEVRVPFLDHELVECALSMDANQLVAADFGRKVPLKKLLRKYGFSPMLWNRPKAGFSLPPEVAFDRRRSAIQAVDRLREMGMLSTEKLEKNPGRDVQYLHWAAGALAVWCDEWVDSGRVQLP